MRRSFGFAVWRCWGLRNKITIINYIMRTILTLLLGVVLVTSCSEDTYLWNEADRVKDYSRSLVGNNVQLVDHLDRIFRAFEYREDVLSGKDGQIIIDRYFSDEHWRLLYNEENDERMNYIYQQMGKSFTNITTVIMVFATIISGYFNSIVFFTLLATTIVQLLIQCILKWYYTNCTAGKEDTEE